MNLEIAFRLHLSINTRRENLGQQAHCPHHFTQILHSFFRNQEAFSVKNRTWKIHKASKETYFSFAWNCETLANNAWLPWKRCRIGGGWNASVCKQLKENGNWALKMHAFGKWGIQLFPKVLMKSVPGVKNGGTLLIHPSLLVFRAAPQLTEHLEEAPCS